MQDRPPPMRATRRRIIELLRRGAATVGSTAKKLHLTSSAVRVHMTALEREGIVRCVGSTTGSNRPAAIYELAPAADSLLSNAYVPFTTGLLRVLGEQLPASDVSSFMDEVGRHLARGYVQPSGTLLQRTQAASRLLNELGALTEVEVSPGDGRLALRAHDCLLAAAVHGNHKVCRAMESFLAELVQARVRECCERDGRPRCCFEVTPAGAESAVEEGASVRWAPAGDTPPDGVS